MSVVVAILSILVAANTIAIQINAFWLTDGSLFQQPVEKFTSSVEFAITPAPNQSQSLSSTTASFSEAQSASRSQEGSTTVEPWLHLATKSTIKTELIKSPKITQSITQGTSNGFVNNNNNNNNNNTAVCQCDSGWLQNQTSAWLNKWLTSAQFANHIKSLGLNSVPRGNSSNWGQNINGNNLRSSSSAWNKHGSRRNERNSQQQQQQQLNRAVAGGHHHRALVSSTPASSARHTHNDQQRAEQQQALSSPVKVVQGERGPRGDQGERGPSGLIAVKNRDALFDLPRATLGPRMAFVESEHLLVVETPGPSWRPVPLLAPLHDFRKTIAKFNLNPAEERRRLLASVSSDGRTLMVTGQDGQSQVVPSNVFAKSKLAPVPPSPDSSVAAATEQLFERAVVRSNTILGALDRTAAATGKGADNEDEDDDEEEEQEGEEEVEEEDDDNDNDNDNEDDLNMEDDDDNEEDDDGSDDEEDNQIGANERARAAPAAGKGARGLIDSLMTNKIPEASRVVTGGKRARNSQVASRSAMSTTGAGNFISAALGTADSQTADQEAREATTGEVMRLRLVALNEPLSGNQHGLRGANFECKRNAARAGVKGAFRALLATNYQNLNEIVRYNSHVQKYPIVNLRGDTLASSWHDLFKAPARASNPLSRIQSFDGRHVASDPNWPNKLVWLGTGSKFGQRDSSSHNCDGWHSDSLNKLGFATPLHSPKAYVHGLRQHHANRKRSQQRRYAGDDPTNSPIVTRNATSSLVFDVIEKYPCRMPLIVLCIETVAQAE